MLISNDWSPLPLH